MIRDILWLLAGSGVLFLALALGQLLLQRELP